MTHPRDNTIVVHSAGRVHVVQRGEYPYYPDALYRALGVRTDKAVEAYLDGLSIDSFYRVDNTPAGPNSDGVEWFFTEHSLGFDYALTHTTYSVSVAGPMVTIEGTDGTRAAAIWHGKNLAGAEQTLGHDLLTTLERRLRAHLAQFPDNEAIKGRRVAAPAAEATIVGRSKDESLYLVHADYGRPFWIAADDVAFIDIPRRPIAPAGGQFAW